MKALIFLITFFTTVSSFSLSLEEMDDIKNVPEVFQREYIETNLQNHEYIQTYGLATCVAIVITERNSSHSLMSHLDARVDLKKDIPKFLSKFKDPIIFLAGGEYGRENNLLDKTMETLKTNGHYPQYIYPPTSKYGMSVMFDLKGKRLYSYDEIYTKTEPVVDRAKVDRMHFGGRTIYRHEESLGGGDYLEIDENQSNDPFSDLFIF